MYTIIVSIVSHRHFIKSDKIYSEGFFGFSVVGNFQGIFVIPISQNLHDSNLFLSAFFLLKYWPFLMKNLRCFFARWMNFKFMRRASLSIVRVMRCSRAPFCHREKPASFLLFFFLFIFWFFSFVKSISLFSLLSLQFTLNTNNVSADLSVGFRRRAFAITKEKPAPQMTSRGRRKNLKRNNWPQNR